LNQIAGQSAPIDSNRMSMHGTAGSETQENPHFDATFSFEESARTFGIMNSCTRLDILNGVFVPRALAAQVSAADTSSGGAKAKLDENQNAIVNEPMTTE
jgi:hypothetical protein